MQQQRMHTHILHTLRVNNEYEFEYGYIYNQN